MADNNDDTYQQEQTSSDEASNKIFTIPNLLSIIRICLVPCFVIALVYRQDVLATIIFAVAAITDFFDGQLARRLHSVSRFGQLADPAIDCVLMVVGIISLYLLGRCPLWIIIVIFARELFLLVGGAILLSRFKIRVPVVYAGKFATAFLFIGFFGLLLNWPLIPGLGLCDLSWLPGFTAESVSWGIWCVYVGVALELGVTVYYIIVAIQKLRAYQTTLPDENES